MTITPCTGTTAVNTGNLEKLLKDVVAAQFSLGKEVLNVLTKGTNSALSGLSGVKMPKLHSCCEIPEPCWMPKALGEIKCQLTAGSTGQVKLIVTNNDFRAHTAVAQSAGKDAGLVQFTPSQIALGPKERTTIVAQCTAPQEAGTYEMVVWVSVCSDHYLRWTVEVGNTQNACCYEVTVDDTPDYVVHWYDHFYCPRPCPGTHANQANG
ncbi:MAG TPA: hypothetical protein VNH44_19610 [Micropepsaceae bacterium]|nr:hypothetical protein [Micropepsaceae bacterium]